MTLIERIVKLRERSPLMTVANLVEITLYGDQQDREGDFLSAAAQVLKCSQEQVDEAVVFTRELLTGSFVEPTAMTTQEQLTQQIDVLDHGYVRFVEAWGMGDNGISIAIDYAEGEWTIPDYEVGIIEAARQSTQGSFRGWDQDAKLLRYLYGHRHATPFEFAGMVIEVQAPIFVFREWHRHRTQSYNEMSARYAPLPDLYYVPTLERVMQTQPANRQSASADGTTLTEETAGFFITRHLQQVYALAEEVYQASLSAGIPKEIARLVMPVGHYSRMRASANLRNWLGFMTLRMDPAAQWEIRQFANAVAKIVEQRFPQTYRLFIDRELLA
jgi:thymidylate synthase (FAD)